MPPERNVALLLGGWETIRQRKAAQRPSKVTPVARCATMFFIEGKGITDRLKVMKVRKKSNRSPVAFTLIELLLVVAVIGILSALVVTSVSNSAEDARLAIARQQQAVMQEALTAWISANSSGPNASLASARTTYNDATAKLTLLGNYLDPLTLAHLDDYTSADDKVQSKAMAKVGKQLQFSTWTLSNYPTVNMVGVSTN